MGAADSPGRRVEERRTEAFRQHRVLLSRVDSSRCAATSGRRAEDGSRPHGGERATEESTRLRAKRLVVERALRTRAPRPDAGRHSGESGTDDHQVLSPLLETSEVLS
jgi:hypothetical protein